MGIVVFYLYGKLIFLIHVHNPSAVPGFVTLSLHCLRFNYPDVTGVNGVVTKKHMVVGIHTAIFNIFKGKAAAHEGTLLTAAADSSHDIFGRKEHP